MRYVKSKCFIVAGGLFLAGLACALPGGGTPEAPTAIPTGVPVEAPPTVDDAPPETEEESPPAGEVGTPPAQTGPSEGPPIGDLSAQGPWLLFGGDDSLGRPGLWAANADGSGVTQLRVMAIADGTLERAVSPGGRYVAYVGSPDDLYATPTLFGDRLADTIGTLQQPLYGPQSQPVPSAGPGDPALEAMRAIVEQPSLAWSPDGSQLAFMGAMDGPTSDLYVLSLDSREITRLTDGPSQGYQPFWSPDGKWIVHAGVSTFGTGAGYGVEAVWAAAADDSGVKEVYDPKLDYLSGDEVFLGWAGNSRFLAHSWDAVCGQRDIHSYDIEAPDSKVHWTGYFTDVAYAPEERALLVTVDEQAAACPAEGLPLHAPGAYLIDVNQPGATKAVDASVTQVEWSEVGAFYALRGDGVVQITPFGDGNVTDVPAPTRTLPLVSPAGAYWAWPARFPETGLWIGPYVETPVQVSEDTIWAMTWSPDSARFIYTSGTTLYRASPPDFTFEAIELGVEVRGPLVWVEDLR